ncbi:MULTISPECIES: FtsB family cell division protein [unclassified Sporolactobacillus]|uniref:FtsB family cell division protein n=1 Tax=unclassified Sporolactobacillus TaxID=2628533 RepID=UPI002368629B|nr:septum formation initiator family protein [Sporolactobacillus sp. CQH2019]MDD9150702.1 septum formation initiator family protein [Sporolactobacillus sp. CQH2019]
MENAGTQRVAHLHTDYAQSLEIIEKRQKKRRKGLIRRLIAFAVVFVAVCIFMVSSLVAQTHRLNGALAQKAKLEKSLNAQNVYDSQLKQRIRLLNDKNYIGEVARRDYLLSKNGEVIFSKSSIDGH